MPVQPQYLAYVLEQLERLGAVRSNRMFGGVGLYSQGLFFGLIDDDTLFFKTNDANIADYRARNMPRFMPFPDRPVATLGYHQVPAEVIEDAESLVAWARKSVAVALASRAAPRARRTRKPLKPSKKKPSKKTPPKKKKPLKKKSAAPRPKRR